jgi:hypothetical protein
MAPPVSPPRIALGDDNVPARLRLRLWQTWWSLATIMATAWCMTLGAIPGILAAVIAKHILVAVFVVGLDLDARTKR